MLSTPSVGAEAHRLDAHGGAHQLVADHLVDEEPAEELLERGERQTGPVTLGRLRRTWCAFTPSKSTTVAA